MSAGQLFSVSFLATGMVDDSGTKFLGWSVADARMEMRLPFLVVELGPR